MIYFGSEVSVATEGSTVAQFECECCGHQQTCIVEGRGRGEATNRYFLDGEGSKKRADEKAQNDLGRSILHAFELASCPRCGRRSPAAVRRYWLKLGATLLGIAALAVGIRFLSSAVNNGRNEVLDFMTWMLLAVLPVVLGYELWKNWFTVDSRVHFHHPEESRGT